MRKCGRDGFVHGEFETLRLSSDLVRHCLTSPFCLSLTFPEDNHLVFLLAFLRLGYAFGCLGFLFLVPEEFSFCLVRRRKSWETEEDPAISPTKKELIDAERMSLAGALAEILTCITLGCQSDLEASDDVESLPEDGRCPVHGDPSLCSGGNIDNLSVEGVEAKPSAATLSRDDGSVHSDTSISLKQRSDGNNDNLSVKGVEVKPSEVATPSGDDGSVYRDTSISLEQRSDGDNDNLSVKGVEVERSKDAPSSSSARLASDSYLSTSKEFSGDTQGVHIHNRSFLEAIDDIGNSFKHEMWRKWSTQSAGFSNAIFEAADIVPNDTNYVPQDPVSGDKTNGVNHIRSCLLNLEAEVASLFHLLRLRADALHEGHESSLEELQRLSDDNEFQETTIMKALDILRSTHAELAVLEGKMALAISEAQKLVEEKQRKIDGAQRALEDCIEEKQRKIDGAQRALEDCVHNLVYASLRGSISWTI